MSPTSCLRSANALSARSVALVGPTLHDVREVMIGGESGLVAIADRSERPHYESSRRRLVWPNGAVAYAFSAEDPDSLRGPQFDAAWCDEIAAWAYPDATWDTLQMALRLGGAPQCAATTTPRPIDLVKRLVAADDTILTRSATSANAVNLAPGFLSALEHAYGGTDLARQEISGELILDAPGALWPTALIERVRTRPPGALERVVVGVDPPASVGEHADACGIIACGRSVDGRLWVLGDASLQGAAPLEWATAVRDLAARFSASEIVAEANQGGEMVREVLRIAGVASPIELVRAVKAKRARAEPIAALYAQGAVRHVPGLAHLEREMERFGVHPRGRGKSPDRVDALVWALARLCGPDTPRLRRL